MQFGRFMVCDSASLDGIESLQRLSLMSLKQAPSFISALETPFLEVQWPSKCVVASFFTCRVVDALAEASSVYSSPLLLLLLILSAEHHCSHEVYIIQMSRMSVADALNAKQFSSPYRRESPRLRPWKASHICAHNNIRMRVWKRIEQQMRKAEIIVHYFRR